MKLAAMFVLWALLILAFVGCGAKQIPAPTIVPPSALLEPVTAPLPVFVAPSDPKASSALTPENERLLLALIEDLLARIAAWKAWATAP
jgi:hypothetical protein